MKMAERHFVTIAIQEIKQGRVAMVLRASWLRNGNVPGGQNVFAVMNVMGHTNMSTTMKYQHQAIDEVAEVAAIKSSKDTKRTQSLE